MTTTTTTTAAAAAASAASSCAPKLYEIPTHDAACAMPNSNSSYADLMSSCCGTSSVISYSDCDYYCLAQNQTVGELAECLIKGSRAGEVWCNTNASATATGTASATSTASTSENGIGNVNETGESADPTGTSTGAVESRNIDTPGDTIKLTTRNA
ncbi:hypothetical protein BDW67DRAFT_179120 [Aspergillus spinulosporus]